MITREDLQGAAIAALKSYNNIAIQAATGVGKSKLAIDLCYEFAAQQLGPLKVLLVVNEIPHIKNWDAELKKWHWNFGDIEIICYASLKKYENTEWDVIIFDEAHHLGSDLRLGVFETLKAKHMIFLSATLKDALISVLEDHCGPIKQLKMGLQDAFNANILPEPKINLIPLTLDNKTVNQFIVEEWGNKAKRVIIQCAYKDRWLYKRNKNKYPNVHLVIKCTQQQKYDYITEQFNYYKKRYLSCRNEAIKNKWLQWGSRRKAFLGLEKTAVAFQLLQKIQNKRLICFCTNIEQAEFLGGDNAVHSKKKEPLKIIQNFNDKKINSLFAVGMLQEGMNLTDIEVGVIIQLDGEERAFIQKFGRTLRADSPEQYIIYFRATRDEEYLNNALESIDKNYIKEIQHEYFCK